MAVSFKDYYGILGVDRTASQDEIRKAYRKLAKQYHPDVSKGAASEEKYKDINEAYEVLKDPEKRRKYDALGADWQQGQEFNPPPGWGGERVEFGGDMEGFSDFFRSIFGGFPSGGGTSSMGDIFFGERRGGGTEEAVLELSLEDLLRGGMKSFSLEQAGAVGTPGRSRRTVNVNIPQGAAHGSRIRLKGQGARGDLIVTLRIAPHPLFSVEGHDLLTAVRVSPWEAALGATVTVPTPLGSVSMKLPPGSQQGRKLRLKGKGLPGRKGALPGDLIVRVEIVIPTKLNERERELLESLRRESGFNPRA